MIILAPLDAARHPGLHRETVVINAGWLRRALAEAERATTEAGVARARTLLLADYAAAEDPAHPYQTPDPDRDEVEEPPL